MKRTHFTAFVLIMGYNYGYNKYEQDHQKYPERVIYASENMPPFALENWQKVENLPYVFGDFTWVAMDYMGEAGNIVPSADDVVVNFEISGNGEIAGAGSGSPDDMSSFQQPCKKSWQGKCLAIVRPKLKTGKITLTARAEGLESASIEITTK